MASNPPFPTAPQTSMGPDLGPDQNPETTKDAAPGGVSLGDSLPVVAVPGGTPMTLNGYTPDREQDSLPRPGSTDGAGIAPDGVRR